MTGDPNARPTQGPSPEVLARIGILHDTNEGTRVDVGPAQERCYWNCRPGCRHQDVFVKVPDSDEATS